MRVQAAPPEHYPWLLEKTGLTPTAYLRAIEAVDARGDIRGMVAYDNWATNSVQLHVALATPLAARALLRPTFSYPFEEARLGLVWTLVRASNCRSLRLNHSLGFREAHTIRDGWAKGEDLVLFEMRKEECRWLSLPARKAA